MLKRNYVTEKQKRGRKCKLHRRRAEGYGTAEKMQCGNADDICRHTDGIMRIAAEQDIQLE